MVPVPAPTREPQPGPDAHPSLVVEDLRVEIHRRRGWTAAVDRVSLVVGRGEVVCLVGESGCGKTLTALAGMRLLPPAARVAGGRIVLDGVDLLALREPAMRRVRGDDVAMVFQEPMTSLDPSFTIGFQLVETLRAHRRIRHAEARKQAIDALGRVRIPDPARRINEYPNQFSGGMRQRVMIAMALLLEPKLLIADEPTTALDVTIEAQILDLLASLRAELGMSVLLITHNLGVVNEIADRVAVMYAGEIVESGSVRTIFDAPRHPYTQGLMRSLPDLSAPRSRLPVIAGSVPALGHFAPACRFAPRCPNRIAACDAEHPELVRDADGRELRCYNPLGLDG
jgi:oligopeptide/dipeptide ABC transporter ATP-binding protein